MNATESTRPLQIGDTVVLSREVLQRRGWYLPELLRARGTVTAWVPLPSSVCLRVVWDRPGLPSEWNPQELCRVAPAKPRARA